MKSTIISKSPIPSNFCQANSIVFLVFHLNSLPYTQPFKKKTKSNLKLLTTESNINRVGNLLLNILLHLFVVDVSGKKKKIKFGSILNLNSVCSVT